jgi:hypothetical protein
MEPLFSCNSCSLVEDSKKLKQIEVKSFINLYIFSDTHPTTKAAID